MTKRILCDKCFGTGRAGMISREVSDSVWRSDPTCPECDGVGYLGRPSLRRIIFEWFAAPEKVARSKKSNVNSNYTCCEGCNTTTTTIKED